MKEYHIRNSYKMKVCHRKDKDSQAGERVNDMPDRVLLTEEIDPAGKVYLLNRGYEVIMGTGISEETVLKEASGCDAILTRNAKISARLMAALPSLKVVAQHGVGVDSIDIQAATRLGVQVTNAPGSNSLSVAEFTIGLMIALSRNLLQYDRGLREGNWNIRRSLGSDLQGKTLGVVGMGNIGRLVARKAACGFDMKVIGYRRHPGEQTDYAEITNNLGKVLGSADFVSLHVPSAADTKKMIGAAEFDMMKPGTFFINTARGDVVDHGALVSALRSGKLSGAAVDVFEGEIPERDDPLLHMDNVIVTPHAAAFSRESLERMALFAAMGVDEVLSGRNPSFPVNGVWEEKILKIG